MERLHRHLEMNEAAAGPPTLPGVVRARARQEPDREALIGGGIRRTWADLDRRTDRVAQVLRRLGLRKGDRAGILAANCPEWVEVFLGIAKAGGVVVPLSPRLVPAEQKRLAQDAGIAVLAATPELCEAMSFGGPTLLLGASYERAIASAPEEDAGPAPQADDLAVIAYTSGTTAAPKGVMWSHRTLLSSARNTPFPAAVGGGARILLCAPLGAGGGLVMASNALAIGATSVIAKFTPEGVLRDLVEEAIELTGLVPTMISSLVEAAPAGWRAPRLRRIYYGAGKMTPQLFARARQLFGCEFQQAYGMTETCILGTRLDPADHTLEHPERLSSAGKPMPGVALRLVDEAGAEVPCGTAGEIWIRSPGNMLGYWRRPQETRSALSGGWYHTADIGRLDGSGALYLLDRKDDMVKSGGLNVSPAEVEAVLLGHPSVEEAAVIGLADEHWGQRIVAIVCKRAGAAVDEIALAALCRSRLAGYKNPRAILFRDEALPRNALGKVLRRELRAQYGSPRAAE